jgi:hypothetical protein
VLQARSLVARGRFELKSENTFLIQICDLPDPEHPGKTYRQANAELIHRFGIGTLVEIKGDDEDNGIRLFVVRHDRDCDQSLLYALGERGSEKPLMWGIPEDCLEAVATS